jgi:hypothetical protein
LIRANTADIRGKSIGESARHLGRSISKSVTNFARVQKKTLEDIHTDDRLYHDFREYCTSQGVKMLAQFYHDVVSFKAREYNDTLSDIAKDAVEIASEYLGLYSSMEHKLGTVVSLSKEELAAIEAKFEDDDPNQEMFDGIIAKVEKVVQEQFKTWQASMVAVKKSKAHARTSSAHQEEVSEVADDESIAENFEVQPANVTSQRIFKKFGAVPMSPNRAPADPVPEEVAEVAEEESIAENFEVQPANVTNQRLLKKFGAVPAGLDTSSSPPPHKK